jgi:pimeloyl-ACP methyl ester carboxylesterase
MFKGTTSILALLTITVIVIALAFMGQTSSNTTDPKPHAAPGGYYDNMKSTLVPIATGVQLPVTIREVGSDLQGDLENVKIIINHGLGAKNPATKGHHNDQNVQQIAEGAQAANTSQVMYTARGHGASQGWQDTAESDPTQFTWERLADDMIALAESQHLDKYIVSGSSMGSATSLYAAIKAPDSVAGLIMVRPPTAWKTRLDRRKNLLKSANRCQKDNKDDYHLVLRGAALADLPPEDAVEMYASIKCPALILTIAGDDAHPVSTAETVHKLIPQSQLVVANSKKEADETFSNIIADFIQTIRKKT